MALCDVSGGTSGELNDLVFFCRGKGIRDVSLCLDVYLFFSWIYKFRGP